MDESLVIGMQTYYLQDGDYIQSGDEYESTQENRFVWKPINPSWIGMRWGYNRNGTPFRWARVRRKVPDGFKISKPKTISIQYDEMWGEDFEFE